MGNKTEEITARRSRIAALFLLCVATVFMAGAIAAPSIAGALNISGKVTGPSGQALGAVRVYAYYYDSYWQEWDYADYKTTNTVGEYAFTGLPTDSYVVVARDISRVSSRLYAPTFYNGKYGFSTANRISTNSTGINIQMALGGAGVGTAVDTAGRPIPGIEIELDDPSNLLGYGWMDTDSGGNFRIGGLPTGSYLLNAYDYSGTFVSQYYNNKNNESLADRISITRGTTTPITVRMLRTGEVINRAAVAAYFPAASYAYTGWPVAAAPVVTYNGVLLVAGTDYTVTYVNNVKTGTATAVINGAGVFTGAQVTSSFKISPKKTVILAPKSPKSKQLKATWKKDSQASGYQVQVSLKKNFKSGTKTATIKKNKTVTKTFTKLKAKKTYYVHVRSYKVINGSKVYGQWSNVKKIKVK